jgi:hypothetical protein
VTRLESEYENDNNVAVVARPFTVNVAATSEAKSPDGYPPRRASTVPPTELIEAGITESTTADESSMVLMRGEVVLNTVPMVLRTESLIVKAETETGELTIKVLTVEDVVDGSAKELKI